MKVETYYINRCNEPIHCLTIEDGEVIHHLKEDEMAYCRNAIRKRIESFLKNGGINLENK